MTPLPNVRILVVDDDEAVRQTLADMLELNGFRVITAANGTEGLQFARRDRPTLIITDVNMPGLTGYELLEALRHDEILRTIPVIVISAKADRAATRQGMELGAADFITKPFTESEVLHSIATRLEKKELLDELDAFAHTVAHDLKNPLATVTGRLDLIGLELGKADEATLRHHLNEAMKSTMRLTGIIDELLILAGVRRQVVVPQPLDMAAIVEEALEGVESLLRQQRARIEKPATWPEAVGYAPWIMQVWGNYISNAAKYGGPEPLIRLGAETSADGHTLRAWVDDSGPGLDEAARAQMFVPFTRISTGRAGSHGLGLSIVRRIVEKLGGKVGVESRSGNGSRFWFELPTTAGPAAAPPFPAG
ncbi:MAG: HAMP domain-containing histidine kinase [Opitutaceae bacterium]|nr:HAMP domain-containing histidine kinase [Opitutaceae bacterium]